MARKAFGPQRSMTALDKARNVGESIQARERENRSWSFAEYGLAEDSAQAALVRQWLHDHATA